MSALNSIQLSITVKSNSVTSKHTLAVFARDELSSVHTDPPQIIIVNTDPLEKSGKHWLLIYFNEDRLVDFFDSLGYDINFYHSSIKKFVQKFTKKYQNVIMTCRLQPLDSSLCSHYCLYYAYCKCLDMRAKDIIANIPSMQQIKCSVPMLFNITDIVSKCQTCKKN